MLPEECARPGLDADAYLDWACREALDRLGVATPAELAEATYAAEWPALGPTRPATDETADLAARYLGSAEPPIAILADDGSVVRWETFVEPSTGEPCDPADESFESLGTIEIDASIGLGVINVVRTY